VEEKDEDEENVEKVQMKEKTRKKGGWGEMIICTQ